MAVKDTTKTGSTPRTKSSAPHKGPSKKKKSKKKKSKNVFRGICYGLLFCFLALFVVAAGYGLAIIKTTPPLDVEEVLSLNQASSLYDRNGDFMDNLHTDEERYVIESDEMPANLKNAFVSIEDERFYKHGGIDVKRILGAAALDVKKILTGKKGLHGASTLTQQLLKNTILTNEISIERKIREVYLALQLERKLSKDQILTAYLNTIPLGGQVYGVEAASLLYFSKNTADLSLIECAYLAGITQAPSYYSAYNENSKADPSRYLNRTKTVLSKMKELGYITVPQYNEALKDLDNGKLTFKSTKKDYRLNYEWFVYPAVSQVKEDLKKKYHYTDDEVSKLMVNGGLKIYTTMDKELQNYTQSVLDNYSNLGITNPETYDADGVPLLQASATVFDYRSNEVLAMVGGRGKQQPQSTNRAYKDLRPIGSTIKPLTVYGPAINEKLITAATPIDDAPVPEVIGKKYPDGGKPYNPTNSPNEYAGLISAREALTHSKNVCSVLVEDKVGLKTGISYGESLGLKFNDESKSSIATLALGQFNNHPQDRDGGNTYTLAGAFATFGNGGEYQKPMLYSKVVDANGKTILDNSSPVTKKVFSEEAAYIMYDMLKGPVTSYNSTAAKFGDMPVAGKTGTTTDSKDLWFAGLSPYLSGAVWIGYDTPTVLQGSSSGCASLWGKIMAKAHQGLEVTDIEEPSDIVRVAVCEDSGKLPGRLCNQDPRHNRIHEEIFIKGSEPTTTCTTHVLANINRLNGKLATPNTMSFLTQSRVFVKKEYVNPETADYQYTLPISYDGSTNNNSNNGHNSSIIPTHNDEDDINSERNDTPDNNSHNDNRTENNNEESHSIFDSIFNRE